MIRSLVLVHILFGIVAMLAMLGAFASSKGGLWHRRCGKIYSYSMALSLLLATVVSVMTFNAFLFLIGLFSAYLLYTGWRLALVRNGVMSKLDRCLAQVTVVCGVLMVAYGLFLFIDGSSLGIALAVLGVVAFLPAWSDVRATDGWPKGKDRIVEHLGRMGGASIATVTAAFVTNVQTNPEFIAWLLPGMVGGALIHYWSGRVRRAGAL